jgi:hypothetical protein
MAPWPLVKLFDECIKHARKGGLPVSIEVKTRTISVGGRRELCVEIAGEPDGKPVLVHPGEPMSRRLYGGWIADAERT